MKKKILIFTGAGISAESGVKTFRDQGGLWDTFKIEEVASIDGWINDPQKVIDFYNLRRKELDSVLPNQAHIDVAELEKDYDVTIVTQNVDDLHERAGSSNIIHLHGELRYLKSQDFSGYREPYNRDLKIGDNDPDGNQLRPDVVWFGEGLDETLTSKAMIAASKADICIIVGTTMQVAPACYIPWETPETCIIYYVDPSEVDFQIPRMKKPFFYHIQKNATEGVREVIEDINSYVKK